MGTRVDEEIIVEKPNLNTAISRLQTGDIDFYASSISDAVPLLTVIEDPNLDYYVSFCSYSELTFKPVQHLEECSMNPF